MKVLKFRVVRFYIIQQNKNKIIINKKKGLKYQKDGLINFFYHIKILKYI